MGGIVYLRGDSYRYGRYSEASGEARCIGVVEVRN